MDDVQFIQLPEDFLLQLLGQSRNCTFRTRQIIPNMPKLSWFYNREFLPDYSSKKLPTVRYPGWLYGKIKPFLDKNNKSGTQTFSTFGIFMEIYVKNCIYSNNSKKVIWDLDSGEEESYKNPKIKLYNLYKSVIEFRTGKDISEVLSKEDFNNYETRVQFFKKIKENIRTSMSGSDIKFGQEIGIRGKRTGWSLLGHPDILTDNSVIDVKNVSNYHTHEDQHLMQILIYTAILKLTGRPVKYMGIYLPMQRKLLRFNVKNVDFKDFNRELFKTMKRINESCIPNFRGPNDFRFYSESELIPVVGSHIGRKDSENKSVPITQNLEFVFNVLGNVPMQIYLRTQQYTRGEKIPKSVTKDLKDVVRRLQLTLFFHAPLNINASEPKFYKNQLTRIREELKIGRKVGARGVIIHVGIAVESRGMKEKESIKTMKSFFIDCLSEASPGCPLLIETPAGEKGELLSKFYDFVKFIKSIHQKNKKYKDLIGIIIDSCHVFASGYEPDKYLKGILREFEDPVVKLIHFNDSEGVKGCCVDRHAECGTGNIGYESMMKFKKLAIENGIPMVTE